MKYKYIRNNEKIIHGGIFVLNAKHMILYSSIFSIVNMKIEEQNKQTIFFNKWNVNIFEDTLQDLMNYNKDKKMDISFYTEINDDDIHNKEKLLKIKNFFGKEIITLKKQLKN